MKISTRTRYGIRAMVEISTAPIGKGVYQKDIAKNQQISLKYLDSIIQSLKSQGLIINVKGKKSGYILTRAPQEVTMLDIHNAFENGIAVIECLLPNVHCQRASTCNARKFWGTLNDIITEYFDKITLSDIIANNIDFVEDIEFPDATLKC